MSNENSEIFAEFVAESQEHLADVEGQLLTIESQGANLDVELINTVFRSIHSIKGASGFLGLTTIATLSHSLENVLNLMRSRELVPNAENVDALLRAADTLRGLINNIDTSNGVDVSAHTTVLHAISERTAGVASEPPSVVTGNTNREVGVDAATMDMQKKLGHIIYRVEFDLMTDAQDKDRTPLALLKDILSFGELLDARLDPEGYQTLDSQSPDSMKFVAIVGTVLDDPALVGEALGVEAYCVKQYEAAAPIAPPVSPAPAAIGAPPAPAPVAPAASLSAPPPLPAAPATAPAGPSPAENAPAAAGNQTDTTVRVSVGLLDRLMNLAGELVLGRNQLVQKLVTRDHTALDTVSARINQVTNELQEAIMQTRMQPLASVFNKFPRVVRDLSSKLGKQCDLAIEGKEVELDKSLIEAINDPLTHLIRNSIDHGVESPGERVAKGKNPSGMIQLKAHHQAGKVFISVTDDGAGIDAEKLKRKAVEKGIITVEEARARGEREALQLIFHPGFSTAEKLSDVSGRGVGMDVVRTNIIKAGGSVDVTTQVGKGTTILIKLPLTLAIIPALIVGAGKRRFALPQVSISELVRIKSADVAKRIERIKHAEVMRLRGQILPLVRLSDALAIAADDREQSAPRASGGVEKTIDALNVIVLETGHMRFGLVVDALYDSEEIVVKPLGSHLKNASCLAGATILGDGRIALILDPAGIASQCHLSANEQEAAAAAAASADAGAAHEHRQSLLLFTNHPSEQFAIPMHLISRIERIRVEQVDTIGCQQVLQYRGASLSLISLENRIQAKPRIDQNELHVLVFKASRDSAEVGLIAPTLVDIRPIDIQLDSTMFREPGVVGSFVTDGRATRMLNLFELAGGQQASEVQEVAPAASTKRESKRILIAEDSAFFRKQVQAMLAAQGYQITACEDGAAAWATVQQSEPFDLVLTDIEMPNMNGLELTQHIRADGRVCQVPIIALTSLAGKENEEQGYAAGVTEYQVKLDRDQLTTAVEKYLSGTTQDAGLVLCRTE